MKWTIHELKKKVYSENDIDQVVDLKNFITEDFNDLVDISPSKISGYFDYIKEDDVFAFYLSIQTTLTMLCSITLKEVKIDLDFNVELYFSETADADDIHVLDGITVDLNPYIFSEIITEKPMRVISEHAYDQYHEEKKSLNEEEIVSNSPFAKLKK
ncbi:MAG TPA: YceD family protein [Candidatus Izemoplasmatales bacterium]|nr:YceD family protein [Candidatus Izemoplasmatales bacterium]